MLLIVDQTGKFYAFSSINYSEQVKNFGIFLGLFQNSEPFIRISIFSTLSAIILYLYFIIQIVLVKELRILRLGLTFIIAGVMGNALDRALYGFVRDFIPFIDNIKFNFADIYLDLGFIFVLFSIFYHKNDIWYPNCVRNPFIIIKKSQVYFANKVILAVLGYFFLIIIFNLSFMKFLNFPPDLVNKFFIGLIPFTIVYFVITYTIAIYLSKRIVGPLVALERFVDELLKDKDSSLALRDEDYFKELEEISQKIKRLKN